MGLGAAPFAGLIIRRCYIADALEVYEFDGIAVGIVEIGVPAGEAAMPLVLVEEDLDPAGLDMGERGIERIAVDQEGMMDQRIGAAVGRRVVACARQYEIVIAAAHEHGAVVLPPEAGADYVLVKPPRTLEILDAEREMQDAGRTRALRSCIVHAGC